MRPIRGWLLALCLLLGLSLGWQAARAASSDNPRLRTTYQQRTVYHWYLARWADNQIVCDLYLSHDGRPTLEDVRQGCGENIMRQWQRTPACPSGSSGCSGLYLVFGGAYEYTEAVSVLLDPPQVQLFLPGCLSQGDGYYYCPGRPFLRLEASEPVFGEEILRVEVRLGSTPTTCEGSSCEVPLGQTGTDGADLTFWAVSSLGDTSRRFRALIRVRADDPTRPDLGPWHVTLVSDRLPTAACADLWWALPPEDGLPDWLRTPAGVDELATDLPYTYLAGQLIAAGQVDASSCADGGLLPGGAASPCGLERARPQLAAWQNRFDPAIWAAAQEAAVPPVVLKRLLAQESQFWPNRIGQAGEFGLGQLSLAGTDVLLLWSPEFFNGFCPQYLSPSRCAAGYASLTAEEQTLLRGAVMGTVDAVCPTCDLGLDLAQAEASVDVFAHALQASCRQVDQVMRNLTGQNPGWTTSYEDLWRFTLANYNAGSGCLSTALEEVWQDNGELDWPAVAAALERTCPGVEAYVRSIAH